MALYEVYIEATLSKVGASIVAAANSGLLTLQTCLLSPLSLSKW